MSQVTNKKNTPSRSPIAKAANDFFELDTPAGAILSAKVDARTGRVSDLKARKGDDRAS